ncbi:LOW QUALITY PROTEIN: queuosine biosynthesis QueC ATPase [Bacillus sp. JCM 19046]|nr:LOW QUALITY PROTEIN: queuosine biosynthesis QueC ATPase [Bacillus sp. JCM 19046]
MKEEKAIVVFSGGQDSTTCLFWALERFSEVSVIILITATPSKRNVCGVISKDLGVESRVLDMTLINQLSANALTRTDIAVDGGGEGQLPSTFVAGRNHLFLSFAAVAAREMGARHLITGVCETDFSGYPDCRDVFIKSLNVTLNLAMDENFVIHTPLMWLNKAETWALADNLGRLNYVRERTLTCYEGIQGDGCGECPSCQLRQNGLDTYLAQKEGAVQ